MTTHCDPIPGWDGNVFGSLGYCTLITSGLQRVVHCSTSMLCEFMPADFITNSTLAVAWDTNKM